MSRYDALVRPDRIGPAIARVTSDERWLAPSVALVTGGKSNLTFELTSEAGQLILRRPPSGALLPRAHDMGREVRIQRALAGTSVPVADIVLDDPSGELLGVPCYVMRKVAGHVIREDLPPGYAETDEQKRALSNALVDVLADLHTIDPGAVGLADYGRAEGFFRRQVRRWTIQWTKSKTDDVKAIDELGARLDDRVPAGSRGSIVHGDYRLDNCLMDLVDPGRVAAVLDWELSALGDPLTDLGLLLFYWREPDEPKPLLTPALTGSPGFASRRDLAERYAARTGVDLDDLAVYEAFAHFKFAVIAQGIAARVAAGAMVDQDFGDLSGEVVRIAEAGLARLERDS